MIPSCLGSFSQSLQYLSLAGNKLTGNIPQTYVKGNALHLIDFSSNKLYGQLPRALVNCRMLEFLDELSWIILGVNTFAAMKYLLGS
ncbi:hypothetical protein AHAS_Ahas12G0177700 [Arachis hypogaea]